MSVFLRHADSLSGVVHECGRCDLAIKCTVLPVKCFNSTTTSDELCQFHSHQIAHVLQNRHCASLVPTPLVFRTQEVKDPSQRIEKNLFYTEPVVLVYISKILAVFAGISYFQLLRLATALVSSRVDYCNFVLCNTVNKDIAKLWCAQNCLARVVLHCPHFFSLSAAFEIT